MEQLVIELTGLTKKYGSFTAVDGLDLSIPKGEIFGLLGPNGAGKSTTILMLLGLSEPSSGSVKVCGIDSTRNPIEVKRKVGYLPENVGFYENRSGFENLLYTARLNGMGRMEAEGKVNALIEKVGLQEFGMKKTGKYSRGMRQRLGLADVLIKDPEVIVLDEPTLGIDPEGLRELLNLIVHLSKDQGITVLLSSHHLHQVQQVCDRVGLFVEGRLIAEGNIEQLSAKLFPGEESFIVEAGVSIAPSSKVDLKENLLKMNGVMTVNSQNGTYYIGCSRDLTSAIARTVLSSGADLNYLRKKEYGLDDIYYRYFEGGKAHG